jgi:hypothetical protein
VGYYILECALCALCALREQRDRSGERRSRALLTISLTRERPWLVTASVLRIVTLGYYGLGSFLDRMVVWQFPGPECILAQSSVESDGLWRQSSFDF